MKEKKLLQRAKKHHILAERERHLFHKLHRKKLAEERIKAAEHERMQREREERVHMAHHMHSGGGRRWLFWIIIGAIAVLFWYFFMR